MLEERRSFFFSQTVFNQSPEIIAWRNELEEFEKNKASDTGIPIVVAGMRHLAIMGRMRSRTHMIVASFLVLVLLIEWHQGEVWSMLNLLDGGPESE